ncbi:MAG: VWA domain-containing protein [Spirochaetes bacterium]|nr:VWA domain-containing protein [Spirochaetota bacterium]
MGQIEFKNPLFLLLLVPYAAMAAWYLYGRLFNRESAFAASSERVLKRRDSFRSLTYRFLPILRFAAILLLILAVARPGRGIDYSSVKNLGIDIMIALDASGSMQGEDFQPNNRLAVAKQVIKDFVSKRKSDRVGMVVFAGEAYLQCPLTVERQMVMDITDEIDFDSVPVDGTAIGDALALATSRMLESKARSKIILLLTDGVNNKGKIDPDTAAKTAAEMGIKVYCVGIGSDGLVPYPSPQGIFFGKNYLRNQFDETGLREIAKVTGGKFYRATSSGVLWENIRDIDRLERSEVEARVYHEFYDKFHLFLVAGIILFLLEVILRSAVYRKIP